MLQSEAKNKSFFLTKETILAVS